MEATARTARHANRRRRAAIRRRSALGKPPITRRPPALQGALLRLGRLPLDVRLFLGVLVVATLLRLWTLGAPALDYDEGVYWQSLRSMAAGHALFGEVFSSQPPAFLLLLYPIYLLFGQSFAAARLAIALYSLLGVGALYYAGRALAGRWAGLLAAALLAADPLYLLQSHMVQAEAPALAFETLSVALALDAAGLFRTRRSPRARRWLAAASGAALVVGTLAKLFVVVALVPDALYLAAPFFAVFLSLGSARPLRRPSRARLVNGARAALPALGAFAGGALVAAVVLLAPFAGQLGLVYDQAVAFHLAAARLATTSGWRNPVFLLTPRQQMGDRAAELYPIALLAWVALALAARWRVWRVAPLALWLVASFIVLVKQQPLFDHHRTLLSPPLALLAGLALPLLLARALPTSARRSAPRGAPLASPWARRALGGALALALALGLAYGVTEDGAVRQPLSTQQQAMAHALDTFTTPGDQVATDDQYIAGLADRNVPPPLVDTSGTRIASTYLTTPQIEGILTRSDTRAILFASGRFDALPGFRGWVELHYTQVATFGPGQALYLKQARGPTLA